MLPSINSLEVKVEVTINADINIVWKCLINETTNWWSKDFYTNPKTKGFHIDSRIGGRVFEDFGNGEGLSWAEIIGLDSPNSILMKGFLAPDFGGPAISYISIQLSSNGTGTNFKLTDTLFGAVNEGSASQIEAGWRMIYEEAFKTYVEAR